MSLFSKIEKFHILPDKKKLMGTIVISLVPILLYIISTVLYILICCNKGNVTVSIFAVTIIEAVINFISIIVCLLATRISDIYIENCVNSIKQLEQANDPCLTEELFSNFRRDLKRVKKFLLGIKIAFCVFFAFYMGSNLTMIILQKVAVINIVNVILSSVSAVISIILGLISTVSCFTVAKFTYVLLSALKKSHQELLKKYNDLRITISHQK